MEPKLNLVLYFGFFLVFYSKTVSTNPVFEDKREPRDLVVINDTAKSTIVTGVGGGFYRMTSQQAVSIQSSNYGRDTYRSGEATTWRFFGTNCGVSAFCPCFDIPSSFKCIGDYLKITDVPAYDQRFCGESKPTGIYRSSSGHLKIRFRSDIGVEGRGFQCYVFCTAFGQADPPLPSPLCFTSPPRVPGASSVNPGCPLPGQPDDSQGTGEVEIAPPQPNVPPVCRQAVRKPPALEQKVNWVPIAGRRLFRDNA